MTRLLHAVLLGLIGAGIIHIVILLLLPAYSQRDAWSALSTQSNYYAVTRLDPPGAPPLIESIDPLFNAVACRFDLDDGVLRVHGIGDVPYWSVSVYDRAGQNIINFNDSSTTAGALDFVVATPLQMIELRNDLPPEFDRSVFIQADVGPGIVVVRAFAPDDSWEQTVTRYLDGLACQLH